MDYMDHLNYNEFKEPVLIRLVGASDNAILPTSDIDRLLSEKYGLDRDSTLDVALTIGESRAEISFDGAAVENAQEVIDDIKTMVENFNEVPDDRPDLDEDEWKNQYHVHIDDISRV